MKPVLIKQPKGLGDIFFCQKIALSLKAAGHDIVWPIISKYGYLGDYMTGVNYVDIDTNFNYREYYFSCNKGTINEFDNCVIIATDGCPETPEGGVMVNKYKLVKLPYNDWDKYFVFKRNLLKEEELYNKLNPSNDPYIFVNQSIGGPGEESRWQFNIPTDLKVINLQEIEGYTIFDWCKILENATEFHIMETCISYLIEKLKTKQTIYKMYHRSVSTSPNFKEFMTIYSKPTEHIGRENIVMLQN